MHKPGVKKWFTLKEATEHGLKWKDWHDITAKKDEWVKSDDDYVAQITSRFTAKDSNGYPAYVFHTVLGGASQKRKTRLLWADDANILRVTTTVNKSRIRINAKEKAFANMVVDGVSPADAVVRAYPSINPRYAKRLLTTLIKKRSVVGYMSDKLKAAMQEAGVDEHYLVSATKGIVENSSKGNEMLEAIKLFLTLQGHLGKVTTTQTKKARAEFEDGDIAFLEGEVTEKTEDQGLIEEGDVADVT